MARGIQLSLTRVFLVIRFGFGFPGAAGRKLPTPELLPSLMHVDDHVIEI